MYNARLEAHPLGTMSLKLLRGLDANSSGHEHTGNLTLQPPAVGFANVLYMQCHQDKILQGTTYVPHNLHMKRVSLYVVTL